MSITMNEDIRTKWVEALRSGDYEQGQDVLRTEDDKFCCLGVLCDIAVQEGVIPPPVIRVDNWMYEGDNDIELPIKVIEWAGLRNGSGIIDHFDPLTRGGEANIGGIKTGWLSDANDRGVSFTKIADFIEGKVDKAPVV